MRRGDEELGREEENGDEGEDEESGVGDVGGSLHARTVRWVCEQMLTGKTVGKGVEFTRGGRCVGVGWNWLDGQTPESSSGSHIERDLEKLSLGNTI